MPSAPNERRCKEFAQKARAWFADLQPADPTRFFRTKRLRTFVDRMGFVGDDYRHWLARQQAVPSSADIRVALICLILNNLSHFNHDLLDHLRSHSLHSIAALDLTKAQRLSGNHLYLLWSKTRADKVPEFSGAFIW